MPRKSNGGANADADDKHKAAEVDSFAWKPWKILFANSDDVEAGKARRILKATMPFPLLFMILSIEIAMFSLRDTLTFGDPRNAHLAFLRPVVLWVFKRLHG